MNRQIEREYREALDALRFSRDTKERMAKALAEGQETRAVKENRFRPLRAGLIAACLCLALVGTAFAASAVYDLMVKTYDSWMYRDEELTRFEVYGEVDRYALEDFSQQLQEDYAGWKQHQGSGFPGREFDSWEEAKAYLGEGIPCTWRDTSDTIWESGYRVQAVPDLSGNTDKLHFVQLYNNARLDDWRTCETVIYLYGEENPRDYLYGMAGFQGANFQVLEDYPMANGCTAQVVAKISPPDDSGSSSCCFGFFMKSGILYEVMLYDGGQISQFGMETQLHQVLDTFE